MYAKTFGFAAHSSGGKSHDRIINRTSSKKHLEARLEPLKLAVEENKPLEIAKILCDLAEEEQEKEFKQYLSEIAEAFETNRWDTIGSYFLRNRFIHKEKEIAFLLAPLSRRVNGENVTKLTLVVGEVRQYSTPDMEKVAIDVFGKLNQPIPKLISLHVVASAGNIGGEEAFIAPGAWMLPDSDRGVSILCQNLHIQRYNSSIRRRIERLWEPATAELLLSAINDIEGIVKEYEKHEEGHAVGLGIDLKNRLSLVSTPHQAGWEEYKTDVSGFRMAEEVFSPEDCGKLIACTILIRWGIDFLRPGAPLKDHDALSSLLILDRLLQSGEVYLTSDRQLALRDISFEGLFRATQPHRIEAQKLVREELACLSNPSSIVAFYQAKTASPEAIALHGEFIERCRYL